MVVGYVFLDIFAPLELSSNPKGTEPNTYFTHLVGQHFCICITSADDCKRLLIVTFNLCSTVVATVNFPYHTLIHVFLCLKIL